MEPDTETLDICLPLALYGAGDFRPEWRTVAVTGLATGILEDGAFERLPILADALEEAGCTDEALLRHCRDPIPHHDQCWALGLALNRYIPPEPELPPPPAPVIAPPRPTLPPRRPTSTADADGGKYFAYIVAVIVYGLFKGVLSGGCSTPPPTYIPAAPRPFVPVVVPAPEKPNHWSLPTDRRLQELLGTNQGPVAPPSDPPPTPAWLRPKPPNGNAPPATR